MKIKRYAREREANHICRDAKRLVQLALGLLSRGGTFSRRERHAFNCIIQVAASFPSFKTVDEAGEALYGRPAMKTLRACFATAAEYFDLTRCSGDCLLVLRINSD
jgi:hypothetical protein